MKRQCVRYLDSRICWLFNDKFNFHRDGDLPSYIYYGFNKKLVVVNYHQCGKLHRTTGPAYINYWKKTKEYWYQNKEYASLEQMQMVEACR